MEEKISSALVPTGVPGLDDILRGGVTEGKMYLLSGSPGTGKTTFSLQFITEGISRGVGGFLWKEEMLGVCRT